MLMADLPGNPVTHCIKLLTGIYTNCQFDKDKSCHPTGESKPAVIGSRATLALYGSMGYDRRRLRVPFQAEVCKAALS